VPAVVDVFVFVRGLFEIDLDQGIGHVLSPGVKQTSTA